MKFFLVHALVLFLATVSCSKVNIETDDVNSGRNSWGGEYLISLNARTDWLSTTRNYVLKELDLSGTKCLSFSTDCGATWSEPIINTIGTINFVHWFSDGTCLMCSPTACYWTEDYKTLYRSLIVEDNGKELLFRSKEWHFNVPNSQPSEVAIIDGIEYLMWGDYCGSNTDSSVWLSEDNGHTIRRVLKNNESVIRDVRGNAIPFAITHIHKVTYDKLHKCYWITTGDYGTKNKLIKAEVNNGRWQFIQIIEGERAKFVDVFVDEDYLYCVTDYTGRGLHNGLLRCPLNLLGDIDHYEYLWEVPNEDVSSSATKKCLSNYFHDNEGNRIIMGDDGQFNIIWYAYQSYAFKEIIIESSIIKKFSVHYFVGPNNNGDIIAPLTTYGWSGGRDRMGLNRSIRVLISSDFWSDSLLF